MAAIRKRGKRYHVQIRKVGHPTQTKTFLKLSEARTWVSVVESELERGVFIDTSDAQSSTVGEVIERFRANVLASKTGCTDDFRLDVLDAELGAVTLAHLKTHHLATYRDRRSLKVKPDTIRRELGVLSRVLNTCQKDWGIHLPQGNPVSQIRLPKPSQGRERRLEAGEEERLLSALRGSIEVGAIVPLAIETAMRRGELAALEWQHIDLNKRTLHIPHTKTDIPRTIPLPTKALSVLRSLPRRLDGRGVQHQG